MALPAPRDGSTVVVTGASSGIGTELARALARRGYGVTLVARRADRLRELADELSRGHGITATVEQCDLGDREDRERLLHALEVRDVVGLCNNAGYGNHGPAAQADVDWELGMVAVNVEALHHLTLAVLPRFVRARAGAILNVASLAAAQPIPKMATYAATKAFVASFGEAVHAELKGTGVSVTTLMPGPVHTEFGEKAGVGFMERSTPELAYVDAVQVAEEGIEGMLEGRRTVVPTLKWKATGVVGRLVPRTFYLPLARRFS